MDWNDLTALKDLMITILVGLGFIALLVALRTLTVIAYLPFHFSLNRRDAPMEKRELRMRWAGAVLTTMLVVTLMVGLMVMFDG